MIPSEYSPILREAADIADEREASYGRAAQNMEDIATMCNAMFGLKLTSQQVVQVFIATKATREKNNHKDDNLIDTINYTAILLLLIQKAAANPQP
jgi:hypothetical protein